MSIRTFRIFPRRPSTYQLHPSLYTFLPRHWHVRFYSPPTDGTDQNLRPQQKSTSSPTRSPTPGNEVHEGAETLNVPNNPPEGGPAGGLSFSFTKFPLFDALLTTFLGLGAVFVGGVVYIQWYKRNALDKIEAAFEPGYDPALELAKSHTHRSAHEILDDLPYDEHIKIEILQRKEQAIIDHIIHGQESGYYFMLLGPKGSGKGAMIFDAMAACDADGVSVCDAHPDLEVFRLRLGKALNYEFNEDTQTGLFQRRDPREGGPALDIERAMNKLEKVALRIARARGRPLVLVINNVHYFEDNDGGRNMLLQLQQKAEAWAASGILTMVFTSDDFWTFHTLRKGASRMHVVSVYDLEPEESFQAVLRLRKAVKRPFDQDQLKKSVSLVGGRLAYLNKIARAKDMFEMAVHLREVEKGWLLSQIGLIPDCDDDVMDEQKWSSSSWLLLREFVKLREEQLKSLTESGTSEAELPLPAIPYWKCRQIMTRTDFLDELDKINIISIDIQHNVRPDSHLILSAAQEIVNEAGFDELLENVRNRIDEIESLHRTREITFKDLNNGDMIRLSVDKRGAELLATLNKDGD